MATLVRITARPAKGFRRAGLHHPARPVEHPAERFSAEQLAALQAEPQLLVELVQIEDSEGGNAPEPSGDGKSAPTPPAPTRQGDEPAASDSPERDSGAADSAAAPREPGKAKKGKA